MGVQSSSGFFLFFSLKVFGFFVVFYATPHYEFLAKVTAEDRIHFSSFFSLFLSFFFFYSKSFILSILHLQIFPVTNAAAVSQRFSSFPPECCIHL